LKLELVSETYNPKTNKKYMSLQAGILS
jgi:hypothetical protein